MSPYTISYTIFYSIVLTITLITSCFWISYLLVQFRKKHAFFVVAKLNLVKSRHNERDQYKYLIRCQMMRSDEIKCLLILGIHSVESLAAVCIWISKFLPYSDLTLKFDGNFTEKVNSCDVINQYRYINLSHFDYFLPTLMLYMFPVTCLLISNGLILNLLKLIALQTKYSDAWWRVRRSFHSWLLGSFSVAIVLLLLTAVPYTRVFSMHLFLILALFCMPRFYLNARNLRIALNHYAIERLIQFGNNRLELKQALRFKITSYIVGISFLLVLVAAIVDQLLFDAATFLYFGKCYFPLVYNFPYEPILTTPSQQIILFQVNYYITKVNNIFCILAGFIVFTPFLLLTLLKVYQLFYNRCIRKIRIRYNYEYLEALIREK